jgi:chromosomal replication initiator protein
MTQAMAPVLGKLKTGADRAQQPRFGEEDLPIPEYTFDSFVVGTANAFTYAVAESVSDTPGAEYNPLFIYGDVGLGKTHLLNAIGISILRVRPNAKVSYLSSSAFGSKLVDAIQRHELDAFRERYSDREVLIIDDIQFLAGRERAQEEFFNIFNDLYNNQKQIVIAGDKEPDALDNLEKRLVSRFAGGIVSGLKPPEWDMRLEILQRELARANATVPDEVLTLIATQVTDDIRKLSGSLKKVIAFCQLSRQKVTVDLAQEILGHLFRDRDRAWARRP